MTRPPVYTYISSRAGFDPVRTIYLIVPSSHAGSAGAAERFAESSGWKRLAEEDGAVLVAPLTDKGWAEEDPAAIAALYARTRGGFPAPDGRGLFGRDGMLWCWETLVDIVGYQDGGVYAGKALAASPGLFAAAALIGGAPEAYDPGDGPSGHYMLPQVSPDYRLKNRDIPVCLWVLGAGPEAEAAALERFFPAGAGPDPDRVRFGGADSRVYVGAAGQLRLSSGQAGPDPDTARTVFQSLFAPVIRWKTGPDGTLAPLLGREALSGSGRFLRERFSFQGRDYSAWLHLPAGRETSSGLPLVLSLHGRGEPAWMFAQKNGWPELADETGAFAVAVPDSPENIWFLDRDGDALAALTEHLAGRYGFDRERIYLTGFSNGAMMTRQAGTSFPGLFAGLAPSNGPASDALPGAESWPRALERLEEEGWQMPYFAYAGDRDPAAPPEREELLERMLRLNGCAGRACPDAVYTCDNVYTPQQGYREGARQRTEVWLDGEGLPRAAMTVMADMPHGAIPDESRSAWMFLARYRRPAGSRTVVSTGPKKEDAHAGPLQ